MNKIKYIILPILLVLSFTVTYALYRSNSSGKVFTSSVMIDGKGCNWSTGSAINCGTNQPQPNWTNAIGHSGSGYARITLIN